MHATIMQCLFTCCFSRHDLIGLECRNTIFYPLEGNIKSLLGQTLNTFLHVFVSSYINKNHIFLYNLLVL